MEVETKEVDSACLVNTILFVYVRQVGQVATVERCNVEEGGLTNGHGPGSHKDQPPLHATWPKTRQDQCRQAVKLFILLAASGSKEIAHD